MVRLVSQVCAPRFKTNNSDVVVPGLNATERRSYFALGRCLLFNSSYQGGLMFSTDAVCEFTEFILARLVSACSSAMCCSSSRRRQIFFS